jgi:GDP-mannose 6-dehydrogenase
MKISIFGLGYVGCVSAACLARDGHEVIGVDTNPAKVAMLDEGTSPIVEPGLPELIASAHGNGRLRATADAQGAVHASEMSFVCIQTPSVANGSMDLRFITRVAEEIGAALRDKTAFHVVVFRSTMLPSTMETLVLPLLEQHSGRKAGVDFGLAYHPEFLREGSAIADYCNPPRTVIGSSDPRSAERLASLYKGLPAPVVDCGLRTAELVKYVDNAFHALKVAFSNEIGSICRALDVDSQELMRIFCLDTKLNLSPTYLKPGYAFGGSCLPKDLRALTYMARMQDLQVPILDAALTSNTIHKQRALALVMAHGKKSVGVLGLSFKDGTDDLRESPSVELVEQLIGKGFKVCIYDPNVALTQLMGANKAYIDRELPHIASLMVDDLATLLARSEVVVAATRSRHYAEAVAQLRPDQTLVDLVRLCEDRPANGDHYHALVG